ncbi:hypothetical protein TUMEXPCC7403_12250 [Tumidithrix helvetica PCC 7403]|uniref:HEAT repeat domain-containing protein n=1 Tax=Tumidithrix helvetica TaxID=3457545 RepID=UPI003CA15D3E
MKLDTETASQWSKMLHNEQTSTEMLENMFYALEKDSTEDPLKWEFYQLIARHANAPFRALESVIYDYSWRALAAVVAANENAPSVILENLLEYKDWSVRLSLALNPTTPRRILELLADEYADEVTLNPSIAREIEAAIKSANRDNLDIKEILTLSQSSFRAIRITIAESLKTPVAILEQLALDKDFHVRTAIARNPNTPALVLAKLAGDRDPADEDFAIPQSVASNPSTPISILEELITYGWNGEPIEDVQIKANTNLQRIREICETAMDMLRDGSRDRPNHGQFPSRQEAVARLVALGGAAFEPLCQALQDSSGYTRRFAAEALGRIDDPRAVMPLLRAFQESEVYVQRHVAFALAKIGDARAVAPLYSALWQRNVAREALSALHAVLKRTAGTVSSDDLRRVASLGDDGIATIEVPDTDGGYLAWNEVEEWLDYRPVKHLVQMEMEHRGLANGNRNLA